MIYTLLAEGFEEVEALTVVDILRRAEIAIQTVSITDNQTVVGGHGIPVVADITLKEMQEGEMIFLPGGMPGVTNLEKHPAVIETIQNYASKGKLLAAICAAPKIYGQLGLLNGKQAVCYPGFEEYLKGANVLKLPVVQDGNIITSRGAGTAAELAFFIISLLKDKTVADRLRTGMIYE